MKAIPSLRSIYRKIPVIHELVQIRENLQQVSQRLGVIEAIRLCDFDLGAHPRYGDPKRLHRHAFQVASQGGEDGMIQEIFRRIGVTNRVFVEIGVGGGEENNTQYLLSQGWTGFWIDGSDTLRRAVAESRLAGLPVRPLVSFVTRENVTGLLNQLEVPAEFDLLSIDIDQNTYHVWDGLTQYRPRVVVIEYNASLPPQANWKVRYEADRTWDGTNNFGASLKAFELLGREKGYHLVGADLQGINAFFVRSDLTGDQFATPFTAENHHEPPRYALAIRRGHRPGILDRG